MGSDEEIYGKYADELLRFAATLVGPSSAEDVLANAVLRSLTSPGWATVRAPRAYLYRAVLNEARQQGRSTKRRVRRESVVAASELISTSHVHVEVFDALRRLSLRQRAVVFLTYWLDLPLREVAATLHVSPASAERELRAARRRLKEWLR